MKKAKNRTATTIVVMTIMAISILSMYLYWAYRTNPLEDASVENMSEVEKLINKDLELYYPETPREVVRLFGNMMKTLYNDIEDDDVEALAKKIRELYDEEFVADNPEETYLMNLYSDIAKWKDKDRRITMSLLVNENLEQQEEIDGIEYAVVYVSFTIQESGKFTETWKVMLRRDTNKKWKILGWQIVPEEVQ